MEDTMSNEQAAQKVSDIFRTHYESMRYHPHSTVWGIAYHWDTRSNAFSETPLTSELNPLMPGIFTLMHERGEMFVQPELYVPRATDTVLHYSLLAMRNRDLVTQGFLALAGTHAQGIEDIVDDRRLMQEAVTSYLAARQAHAISPAVDFLNFMLHASSDRPYAETTTPAGRFKPLLERLLVRYERSRDLVHAALPLVAEHLHLPLEQAHHTALSQREVKLDATYREAYEKYANHLQQPLDIPPCAAPLQRSPRELLGKRRVRVGIGSGGFIDWEEYARSFGELTPVHFNPNNVVMQQLTNLVLSAYTERYRVNPLETCAEIEQRARETTNAAEAQALYTTLKLLKSTEIIAHSPRINHRMIINRKI